MTSRAELTKTKRGHVVRIPKALAFAPEVLEVEIARAGETLVITPVRSSWADFFENGPFVSEDFLSERMQLDFDDREPSP